MNVSAKRMDVSAKIYLIVFFVFFFSVQGSVFRRIDALQGEFRVGGGIHDSYTFPCGMVGYFTSPGIDQIEGTDSF